MPPKSRTPDASTQRPLSTSVEKLSECNREIESLQRLLESKLERRSCLEREVAAHRPPAINRLPVEILSLIFEEYLGIYHPSIRRLLLVCRHWHNIVMGNELFWSTIDVVFGEKTAVFDIRRSLPYIKACLSRSGGHPLVIYIDLCGIDDPMTHYAREMYENIAKLLYDPEEEEDPEEFDEAQHQSLWQWTENLNWQGCPIQIRKWMKRPLSLLIGEEGLHMKRWKAFTLMIKPEQDRWFHDEFPYPTPQLEELTLVGLKSAQTIWGASTLFPYMPKLRFLDIQDMEFKLEALPIPDDLECLTVESIADMPGLKRLFQLTNLRLLALHPVNFDIDERFLDQKVTFPRLESLILQGDFTAAPIIGAMDFPALVDLQLMDTVSALTVSSSLFSRRIPYIFLSLDMDESQISPELSERLFGRIASARNIMLREIDAHVASESLLKLGLEDPPALMIR